MSNNGDMHLVTNRLIPGPSTIQDNNLGGDKSALKKYCIASEASG